jgi:hypothetical protein
MWTLFLVDYDYIRTPRRDRNKIRMRHFVTLATRRLNFVRHKGHGPIEFPNGLDDHAETVIPARALSRLLVVNSSITAAIACDYVQKRFAVRNFITVHLHGRAKSTFKGRESYGTKTRWEEGGHPCGGWL